jgi:NAD dependent epimerase/dehydratase family
MIVQTPKILFAFVAYPFILQSSCQRSMAFVQQPTQYSVAYRQHTFLRESSNNQDDADRLKAQAEALREQIRKMEENLPPDRRRPASPPPVETTTTTTTTRSPTSLLDNQRVLVVGANGRLGSMVCRHLLRQHPEIKEVIACVHVVSENSDTSRGYGRLSYEVGAEDGIGSIGPAWSSSDERTASFEFNVETMTDYNLQKLRVVECELLDPVQCNSIVEDSQADVVVWCATDFNGNRPRAVSGLNVAFLFRAVTDPTKGRVEVEGLNNMLGAIKNARQDAVRRNRILGGDSSQDTATAVVTKPVDVLLVSIAPDALEDFETPFGTFLDQKRQGEKMIPNDFPSLRYTTLQVR